MPALPEDQQHHPGIHLLGLYCSALENSFPSAESFLDGECFTLLRGPRHLGVSDSTHCPMALRHYEIPRIDYTIEIVKSSLVKLASSSDPLRMAECWRDVPLPAGTVVLRIGISSDLRAFLGRKIKWHELWVSPKPVH
eukprot:gb/GECG01007012.1/.p1 GENE.gb/GECG01007012.1/~~gb/GECG01007012.1/.p1  ORF type:complete len:138 (+),score=6.73 gb/GECG01007012.1/:1-414(+)